MVSQKVEDALNAQITKEAASSQFYLAMASWAETAGFGGVSQFLYKQSEEERQHMMKLIKFVNERGGHAIIDTLTAPPKTWESAQEVFEDLLNHEISVSASINELVEICMSEKDYTTQNFLQWYVAEQIEEEALARTILDKLKLIGSDSGSLYMFDRDMENMTVQSAAFDNPQ